MKIENEMKISFPTGNGKLSGQEGGGTPFEKLSLCGEFHCNHAWLNQAAAPHCVWLSVRHKLLEPFLDFMRVISSPLCIVPKLFVYKHEQFPLI